MEDEGDEGSIVSNFRYSARTPVGKGYNKGFKTVKKGLH